MKKKILVMLLFVALMLTACGEKKEDLTGVWIEEKQEDGTYESLQLFSDGTGIIADFDSEGNPDISYSCTWIAEDGRMKVTVDYGIFGSNSVSVKYEVKGDTLTLWEDSGEVDVYKKEK